MYRISKQAVWCALHACMKASLLNQKICTHAIRPALFGQGMLLRCYIMHCTHVRAITAGDGSHMAVITP